MRLFAHPAFRESAISVAILLLSLLAARLVAWLFARVLHMATKRTTSWLDDRLVRALARPLTYAVVLLGAYIAVHRLPIQDRWIVRLDGVLFVLGVLVLALGITRAYGILVDWYTRESRIAAHEGLAREFGPLLSKLGKIFIVIVAIAISFERFGLDAQSLVVSLGVGSLAIGLAAQDTLSNMIAGFALMLDRPFTIGERIQLSTGEVGDVETIGIRATRIRTIGETLLVIPNSLLVKDRVLNMSRPGRHIAASVDVAVPHGTDLGKAKRVLEESAQVSTLLDPRVPPVVVVRSFGDWAVNLRVSFWAKDYLTQGLAVSEIHEEVYRRLGAEGIDMAYPTQRTISESKPS